MCTVKKYSNWFLLSVESEFRWEELSVILYSYFHTDLLLSPDKQQSLYEHTYSTLGSLKRDFLCKWNCCSPLSCSFSSIFSQLAVYPPDLKCLDFTKLLLSGSFISIWSQETGSLFIPQDQVLGAQLIVNPLALPLSSSWGRGLAHISVRIFPHGTERTYCITL